MSKILLVLALSGCSVALQSKPKTAGGSCSTSHAYWIADAVGVAAGLSGVAVSIAKGDSLGDVPAGIAAAGALVAVLYLASAGNGRTWRAQCAAGRTESVAVR
jgi:hypothetical protein